jgi:predicted SprT family Zn-dependent metalloprotease
MSVPSRVRHTLVRAATAVERPWSELGYRVPAPATVALSINSRYRQRLATADGQARRISLRSDFGVWPRGLLRAVLIHELAHLAVHDRDGRVRPHGEQWQALMRAAGLSPSAMAASVCGNATPHPRPAIGGTRQRPAGRLPYEHRCPVCQMVRYAKRSVNAWRCRTCVDQGLEGVLTIRRNSEYP